MTELAEPPRRGVLGPACAVAATTAATAVVLRAMGREWACPCRFRVWAGQARGPETSQQLLDPYSLTHLEHGVLLWVVLALLAARSPWLQRASGAWRVWTVVTIEALWEVVENTDLVIGRYRAGGALGYLGDTVVNSTGDIALCALGCLLARRLPVRGSLMLLLAVEAVLLVWIRDSLAVSVLSLLVPVPAVLRWQQLAP